MSRPGSAAGAPSPPPDRRPLPGPAALSETAFQQRVTDAATLFGWHWYHTHDARNSPSGWPDLVLSHRGRGSMLFRELKTDTGDVSDDQQRWLDELTAAGLDAAVWRPADWDKIQQVLRGELTVTGARPRPRPGSALPAELVEVRLIGVPGDLDVLAGAVRAAFGDERVRWDGVDEPSHRHAGAVRRYLHVHTGDTAPEGGRR